MISWQAAVAQSAELHFQPGGTVLRARASAEQNPDKGSMFVLLSGATVAHGPGEDSRHHDRLARSTNNDNERAIAVYQH